MNFFSRFGTVGRLSSMFSAVRQQAQHQFKVARFSSTAKAAGAGGIGAAITAWGQANPFWFQMIINLAKCSGADFFAQIALEKKPLDQVDFKRNGVFLVFGFVYLGGFQYFVLVNKMKQWFPGVEKFANAPLSEKLKDPAGMLTVVKQIVLDVGFFLPCIYFPCFYTVKEFLQGKSYNPVDWARDGIAKYINNAPVDIKALWSFWGPGNILVFGVPLWLRMPVRHILSLGWTAYLSYLRGSSQPKK